MIAITFGPDLTPWTEKIVQNHYSHDLHHYYKLTISYNLKPNYTTLVLYNILEHPRYYLGVIVPAGI